MKTTSILLALTAALGVFAAEAPENERRTDDYHPHKPKCNADNCLRGIRGKNNYYPPLTERYEDCKKYQITVVKKWAAPVTKTRTKTVTVTPKPYCPPKHHKPDYPPPKKHYYREAEPEAAPEAEPEAAPEAEAEADPTYEPPSYYPPHVPAYATYCPTPERYASACACVGYPKVTKTVTLPGKTYHAKATATVTAKAPPCPKKPYKKPHHDPKPKPHYEPKPKPTYNPHY